MSEIINPTNPQPYKRIERAEVLKIGEAYTRFVELRNSKIKTASTDAEMAGLTEYLANVFINHVPCFLGPWFVVRDEYEPLVNGFTAMMGRAQFIIAQREMARAQAMQSAQAENVVPLKS